jgi:O-antigen/teichoic acid export membrane protein
MNWGSSIVLGSLSIAFFYFLSPVLFPEVGFFPIIFLGLVNTILVSLTLVAQTTIRIRKMPKLYAAYRLSTFLLQIGISIYFVLILKRGLVGYFVALVVSSFLSALFSGFIMSSFGKPCLLNAGIKDALRFAVPMIPSALLTSFTSILDKLILKQFCSLQTLGIYSIALKFASIIIVVQNSLKLSYGPFFMKNVLTENGQNVIYRMTGFYIFPLFFTGLSLSVFIDKVVYIIGQPSYYPVIEYVPYLAVVILIGCMNVFYANGILLSNRTYLLVYPALLQLVTLLTGVYLIPRYEILGIITAKFLSVTGFVVATVLLSNRVYKLRYNWMKLIAFGSMMLAGMLLNMMIETCVMAYKGLISIVIVCAFTMAAYKIAKSDIRTVGI